MTRRQGEWVVLLLLLAVIALLAWVGGNDPAYDWTPENYR